MARRPRGEIYAGTYHVTTRSAGPIPMFLDDRDRRRFCELLAKTIRTHRWVCRAFCLMTTHYHLLVDVEDNALQPGMHSINGPYAQRFNARHGRSGHLRGDRYRAREVRSDGHMLYLVRYISLNPVKAGFCERPSEWRWGSYRGLAGLDAGFRFVQHARLRSLFGPDPGSAARLRGYVGEGVAVPSAGSVPRDPPSPR